MVYTIKISESELEVLKILWERGKATSKEIIIELSNKKCSQSTIRTFINRLLEKKAIGISEKNGKTYTYVPLIDEKKYKIYVTKKYIEQMYNNSFIDFVLDCIGDDKKLATEVLELLNKYVK